MARAVLPSTWENGFRQPSSDKAWSLQGFDVETKEPAHYKTPQEKDQVTSDIHNFLGTSSLRTWPTLYNGTSSPSGTPDWWSPASEVDVLICGAGPSGLEVALSLARQGVSFRIVDKAEAPLIAGRADGVQPRYLETLHQWGLAEEVHEEGPLIERTAIYKNGKKLFFDRSHQSDSRYRGLHIITQGQIERIFVRDLLRHQKLVERSTVVNDFVVNEKSSSTHPVQISLLNEKTGREEQVKAKFLVGADGAASTIRKRLNIPFDGVNTDIYWGILDCIFETDYPHAWVFGSVISSEHGGCVIIPREDGYIRLYTQLDTSPDGPLARARQAADDSAEASGGSVDIHSITADEVLDQANRIFSPYKLKFGAPLSWFAVWRISERVARRFSVDNRVHLLGDAAHVHSVMGAFGLNASILDAANLAWKIGLCASGFAKLDALVPTYEMERRRHAVKIIHTSGVYLRFICNSSLPVVDLSGVGTDLRDDEEDKSIYASVGADIEDKDLRFVAQFFAQYGPFLLGIDSAYGHSVINPRRLKEAKSGSHPTVVKNGVRAPNPRVCFSDEKTGYLYDKMAGAAIFNLVVFASDILGPVRNHLAAFSAALTSSNGFFRRFGGSSRFRIILVVKCLPFELPSRLVGAEFSNLRQLAEITFDDRAPDEDAHTCYSINHARGAVVVVRPDLWVGTSAFLGAQGASELDCYFEGFLQDVFPVNGEINNGLGDELTNGANGDVWDEINEKFQGKDNGSIEGVINGEHKDRINGGIAKELMADNKNPINSTVSEYTNGLY